MPREYSDTMIFQKELTNHDLQNLEILWFIPVMYYFEEEHYLLNSENNLPTFRLMLQLSSGRKQSTWENHHPIHWEEITVLDHVRGQRRSCIPDDTLRGVLQPRWRTEVPGCWTAVMRRQGGRSSPH